MKMKLRAGLARRLGAQLGILCLVGITSIAAPPPHQDNLADDGLVLIPSGQFWMGDPEKTGTADERPPRLVDVGTFRLSKYEVTYGEWARVWLWAVHNGYQFDNVGRKGWGSSNTIRHPVILVNWFDAVKWCNARSEMERLRPAYYEDELKTRIYKTGHLHLTNHLVDWNATGYRLPTEAEWEKAARDGLKAQLFPWAGNEDDRRFEIDPKRANCWPHVRTTRECGSYPPSKNYGLHDMAGNVWEWCWDWYDPHYYQKPDSPHSNPPGAESGSERVLRGGGWRSLGYLLRCSSRFSYKPGKTRGTFGFRVARSVPQLTASSP